MRTFLFFFAVLISLTTPDIRRKMWALDVSANHGNVQALHFFTFSTVRFFTLHEDEEELVLWFKIPGVATVVTDTTRTYPDGLQSHQRRHTPLHRVWLSCHHNPFLPRLDIMPWRSFTFKAFRTYSNSYIHSYTGGGGCHARCRPAHQTLPSVSPGYHNTTILSSTPRHRADSASFVLTRYHATQSSNHLFRFLVCTVTDTLNTT